jgi:hypothetical protein
MTSESTTMKYVAFSLHIISEIIVQGYVLSIVNTVYFQPSVFGKVTHKFLTREHINIQSEYKMIKSSVSSYRK